MTKHGKKYLAAAAKVDINKLYNPREAMELVRETAITKFDSTIEVHMRMGLDPRQADQLVRDVVVLPHGLGKSVRVLVFAQGDGATNARSAGADVVADDDETLSTRSQPRRRSATTPSPREVLRHIRAVDKPGIYALLDFHPILSDPVNGSSSRTWRSRPRPPRSLFF